MKKIYIIIILILITGNYCNAQDNKSVLLNNYFDTCSISATSVNLHANNSYINASSQIKLIAIDNALSTLNRRIAFVRYGNKREIWGKDASNNTILLDLLDMNNSDLEKAVNSSQKLIKHPWFFYYGGQGMFGAENTSSFAANVRVGCFLLLNRWDAAATFSLNSSNDVINGSTGIMSKYYFPLKIKKQRIAPYIGGGADIAVSDAEESGQINFSALAGISWALGSGSFDLGLQYSKTSDFTVTLGYTFFPWRK